MKVDGHRADAGLPPAGAVGGLLHVVHGWPLDQIGGVGVVVASLCAAAQVAGVPVAVLAPSGRWRLRPDRVWVEGPIPAVLIDRGGALGATAAWSQPAAARVVDQVLRALRPREVHVHHLAGLPLGLPEQARAANAAVHLHMHDYHLVCARGQLLDADGAPCPGPSPARCASCLGWRGASGQAAATFRAQAALRALRTADAIWSPSADLADRLGRFGLPVPRVAPLPLRAAPWVARTPPQGDEALRVLFVGSMHPSKGPDLLVRAVGALPPGAARLRLLGPAARGATAFLDRAIDVAVKQGAQITREAAVDARGLARAFADGDLLVVPSRWAENSPLVVREATAAGLWTMLPSWGGARELDPGALLFGAPRREPPRGPNRDQVIVEALHQALLRACTVARVARAPRAWPHARGLPGSGLDG